jgi:hypothetical protein
VCLTKREAAVVRLWLRYVFLVAWLVIWAAMSIVYIHRSQLNHYQAQSDFPAPPDNQIDGLTCYRYDPCTNKLCFEARIGSLRTENATVGIFKTAVAREIKVKDLRLFFCQSSASSAPAVLEYSALPESSVDSKNVLGSILSRLADAKDRWSVNIDLSNPVDVTIDNFDCRIFDNDTLRLSVKSRRAVLDSGRPQVMLRGHVVITADGGTLESNCVRWDIQKQQFTADGTYFLRQGESRIAGKGICVDNHLNIADAKNARE